MEIKIACAQINIVAGRPDINVQTALEAIARAKSEQVDILLLPEMTLPGYLLGDLWEQRAFVEDCIAYGQDLVAATEGICVIFGNVAIDKQKVNEDGRCRKYNVALIAQNGKLLSNGALPYPFVIKNALPDYREFDDSRYFHSLFKLQAELAPTYSIPDLLQPIKVMIRGTQLKLGVMLCEDGWTENYHYNVPQILRDNGAEILCNISCSPFTLHKNRKRYRLFSTQSRNCALPLIYCNNVGIQNNGKNVFTYDGSSCAYAASGKLASSLPPFGTGELTVTYNTATQELSGSNAPLPEPTETEQIYTALRYGAKKFLEELHIGKMTIGLSGGIDSAVSAAFYIDVLGPENVLLVNMPSQYNSQTTRDLARRMAEALGTNYTIMPITNSVEATQEQLTTTPIHSFSRHEDFHLTLTPLALENIQARDRGARIIAGLAAAWGGAFSCNSNKTELTVGYATFYGDMAGALAIIGDLWKYQVYALGHYLNDVIYKRAVIAPEVFTIAPSAELSAAQTVGTGGDPLIYAYHDYLFRSFVEKWSKVAPEDILTWYSAGSLEQHLGCEAGLTTSLFPSAAEFIQDLEQWWNLFCGFAVAKRIQAPPILSITKRAYGYDHREAQLAPYYSRKYKELKAKLLAR